MSTEVRRVPPSWEHPKDDNGRYIPLDAHFPYDQEAIEEGLREGWLVDDPPNYGCDIMPQWPDVERTHYQMYETVSDGTPISPVMKSPEALARWLVNNKPRRLYKKVTYDQWLAMINAGRSISSFVINDPATGEIINGVEAVSRSKSTQ